MRIRIPIHKEAEIREATQAIRFSSITEKAPAIESLLVQADKWTRTRADGREAVRILNDVTAAIQSVPGIQAEKGLELIDSFIELLTGGHTGDDLKDRLVERGYFGEGPAIFDIQGGVVLWNIQTDEWTYTPPAELEERTRALLQE